MPRDLRLLSAAVALSAAGDMLLVVVLALRVHDLSGSGFAVAALFGALMLPMVLLAGVAGRLVDGFETRRVLLVVSLLQVVVASGLVVADGVAAILVLTALLGAGAAVAGPAEAALVPAAAGETDLARANGWVETARYTGFTAGPLIAAALTAAGGTGLGLAANALSFAAVALAAATMRARRAPAPAGDDEAPTAGAAAPGRGEERGPRAGGAASGVAAALRPRVTTSRGGGLRLLLADPVLRPTIGAAVGALFFISAVMTAEVFYVRDVVGAGAAGYSLVYAGWMAGMVVGAVGIAARVKAPLAVAGLLALALQGAGVAAAAVWPVLAFVLACNVAGGIGHGVKNVLLRTLIQQRVPAAAHGRAFAAYGAARNFAEIGALASGGVIIGVFGPQVAMVIAGLGPVVAAAIGLAWLGVVSGNAPTRFNGLKVRLGAADTSA